MRNIKIIWFIFSKKWFLYTSKIIHKKKKPNISKGKLKEFFEVWIIEWKKTKQAKKKYFIILLIKILSSLNKIGIISKNIKNLGCRKLKLIPQKKIKDENKKLIKIWLKLIFFFFKIFSI